MGALLLLSALITLLAVLRSVRFSKKGKLPPGPRPLPIIGNALDLPTDNTPEAFRGMIHKYGDLVYLDALGQPMVILGTQDAAIDLLDKRSSIYSDRVISTMVSLSGWEWTLALFNYGPWWRRHRRTFHQYFNAPAVIPYRASQELEARRLVLRLIEEPERFLHHGYFSFMRSVMRVTYGMEFDNENDEYVRITEEANTSFGEAFIPGKYWVEMFPMLRFLPSWFPGAKFKRECEAWRPVVHKFRDIPWERTVAAFKDGTAVSSMVTNILQHTSHLDEDRVEEEHIVARNVAGVAFSAGVDTTVASIQWFFLAMAMYHEVQKKAQAELDAIVGSQRLPEFSDESSLPYVCALIRECLRWRPVLPLGLPHRAIEEDVYRGYFIPKGTILVPDVWAYSRDPTYYPDPETFMPERFLKDGGLNPEALDPAAMAFGYGRRICPGRHFALNSLFITMATILHTLSISVPLDTSGKPVKLDVKMLHGVVTYPEPFRVDIKPRGPWSEALVKESCSAPQSAEMST